MSTTLLYHVCNIRGYRYRGMKRAPGGIEVVLEQPRDGCCCPVCKGQNVILKGAKRRRVHAPPIGGKLVTIVFDVPCVECRVRGTLPQIEIAFAKPQPRYIRVFGRSVLDLLESMTCEDVAKHLGVSRGMIRDIEKEHLKRHYAKPRLKHVRRVAIHEIAARKGQKYRTVVLDLDSGRVIFVGDGRGGDSLLPFWRRLRRSRARIKAVATDMSPAYIAAVEKALPETTCWTASPTPRAFKSRRLGTSPRRFAATRWKS